ncbi:FlgD Ig-like domain-containing protein [Candidatus Fervidibacteria bacterium JGI MDM2 SSWTFF-3-K9]
MKGTRGPFQTSITINVQNLVVTSPDVGRVLRWDPEKGIADTSFSYNIECAQRKQVQVTVRIYDMNRNLVYELTEQKICPGSYSFTWDGTINTGYYGYPPGEGSNIAPAGLYTFDVEVIANPYDRDAVRSQALSVVPGPVEYLGYDDGGTPEDESDDNHLYYLRWYALYSGRDASFGEIWLYDPELEMVKIWIVPVLQCVLHEVCDGLTANPNGEIHGVIISVPVSLMEKAGTYRFVLHFYDDYSDTYRNHRVKAALEVNQQTPTQAAWIWIDGLNGADLQVKVNWQYVGDSLNWVCYYCFTWRVGGGLTPGVQDSVTLGNWTGIRYRRLSTNQIDWQHSMARTYHVDVRHIVIFTITSQSIGKSQIDDIARIPDPPPRHRFPPDRPAVSAINENAIAQDQEADTVEKEKFLRSNIVLHELTHLLNDIGNHCRANSPTCVWRAEKNSHFYSKMTNNYTIRGYLVSLPWHTLD